MPHLITPISGMDSARVVKIFRDHMEYLAGHNGLEVHVARDWSMRAVRLTLMRGERYVERLVGFDDDLIDVHLVRYLFEDMRGMLDEGRANVRGQSVVQRPQFIPPELGRIPEPEHAPEKDADLTVRDIRFFKESVRVIRFRR